MILGNAVRDRLQQHRLTRSRRSYDQCTLALSYRCHKVHDACRDLCRIAFDLEIQLLVRVKRSKIVKKYFLSRLFRGLEINGLDLDQREISLALFRRPYLAGDSVAGPQIEFTDLRRADINVVGAGKISYIQVPSGNRSRQAASQERPARISTRFLGLSRKYLEDEFLFAQSVAPSIPISLRSGQLADRHILEARDIQRHLVG